MKFRRKPSRGRPTTASRRAPRRRATRSRGPTPTDDGRTAPGTSDDAPRRRHRAASTSASLLVAPGGPRAAAPGRRAHRRGAVRDARRRRTGALELRAFAAPRNGDLWDEVRPPDRRRHLPARRHRHRARGPLGHRAGLPDAGRSCPTAAPARSPPASSASTAPAGSCAPRSSAARPSSPTTPQRLGGRHRRGRRTPRRRRRCPSATRCRSTLPTTRARQLTRPVRRPSRLGWRHGREEPAATQHQQVGERRRPARARPARDLRAQAACDLIAEAPDRERVRLRGTLRTVTLRPRGGVPALEAELFDGSGSLHAGLARPAPDRRHLARPLDGGRGPDRPPRRRPDHLQPALRADALTRPSTPASAPDDPGRRPTPSRRWSAASSARPSAAGAGMVEAAVPTLALHRALADHPRAAARAGRQRRAPRSCCSWSGWSSARRCSSASTPWSASASAGSSCRSRRSRGGSADDQALAYFLPGLLYNAGYAVRPRRSPA